MLKKILSLTLASLLFASTVAVAASAVETGECDCGKPPLVYIEGQIDIYDDPTSPDRRVVPTDPTTEEIVAAVKPCIAPLAKALITRDWSEYCDAFYNAVSPFYADYALDNEGNVKNSSGPAYTWSYDKLSANHSNNSVFTYEYRYDQRLDPWEIADGINDFIQAVKAKTNHSQVCLMSRCMGTAEAMAYLIKYGEKNNFADICSYVYYNSTAMGFSVTDGFYTGDLALDSKCIARYAMDLLGDDTMNDLLKASIELMQKTYGLDIATSAVTDIYNSIYENVIPRIMRASYGTTPGYWSMVSDKYYSQAKDFIFGDEADEYSVLIDKLDFYHENVQKRIPEMLETLKNTGMPVGVICKYGVQMHPIVDGADEQSDKLIDIGSQSLGATAAKIGSVLSDEYIANAESNGTAKYISADKIIDASTCLLPDNTWFVKDVEHEIFPQGVDPLLVKIARSTTPVTVESFPEFPQYLIYDHATDSISPLTEENSGTRYPEKNFFQTFIAFFKALFKFFKEKLASLFAGA